MVAPVHVMQVIDGLESGGTETVLFDLISRLMACGFRVSVCYCQPGPLVEMYSELQIPLIRIPWSSHIDPGVLSRMWWAMRRDPPQIVHTHLFKSNVHGQLAARLSGVPIVVSTLHNMNEWAKNPILGSIYGLVLRLADKIIVLSDEMAAYFVEHAKIPPSRFITINNAIPIERFEGNDDAGFAVRKELGISSDAPLFGMVARLHPQKDHKTFLLAMVHILRVHTNARFLIVGDGASQESLTQFASSLGLEKSVVFCGHRKDVPAVMAALDVLVLSSHFEGMPVVLLEAMAASRPIVATATRGIFSVVRDGENGLLVPPGDPEALARACLRLVDDPALRRRLVKGGRANVKANHSINVTAKRTMDLYRSLLERARIPT